MAQRKHLNVEIVEHSSRYLLTGISRYVRELHRHLPPNVSARMVYSIDPPFADHLTFLHHLPLGIEGHCANSLVHFTQPLGSAQMLWRPIRPAVATVHDLSLLAWQEEGSTFRVLERLLLLFSYLCLKRMDTIIAVSEYSRQTVIHHLKIPPERVFTIYSGNDGELFRPIERAAAKLRERFQVECGPRYKNLLYVGSELPRKNLGVLLQALHQLPPNVRLLKVGSAGGQRFREQTERMIDKLGLADRVIFLEELTDEELVLCYNAADLYICTSRLEGFGHPVVEAMACGTPVVCSNTSSLPEIVGDAAILVQPDNANAVANAVLTVLENPALRQQMIERGRQRAAMFSWEQTAAQVVALYEWTMRTFQSRA
jgi:glycosyltransferase involved in cell wall biosynthesis